MVVIVVSMWTNQRVRNGALQRNTVLYFTMNSSILIFFGKCCSGWTCFRYKTCRDDTNNNDILLDVSRFILPPLLSTIGILHCIRLSFQQNTMSCHNIRCHMASCLNETKRATMMIVDHGTIINQKLLYREKIFCISASQRASIHLMLWRRSICNKVEMLVTHRSYQKTLTLVKIK